MKKKPDETAKEPEKDPTVEAKKEEELSPEELEAVSGGTISNSLSKPIVNLPRTRFLPIADCW